MEFKLAHRIHTDISMRLRTAFVFIAIVMNLTIAKSHLTDEYPVVIKPVPARHNPVTIFKQPDLQPSPEEAQRAYDCAVLPCDDGEVEDVLCACNFNTGNVVTFKNGCDMKKHNCRFFTDFRAILGQICPWEFQTRRNTELKLVIDYSNSKYYN